MGCNCKVTDTVLAIIVVVFALWQTAYSQWIVVIAGVLLLIHALTHGHTCPAGSDSTAKKVSRKSSRSSKSKRKKRR